MTETELQGIESGVRDDRDVPALIAAVRELTRERDEARRRADDKHADFVRGAKVAHELTHETQTAEDYAVDLVRQVKKARAERDGFQTAAEVAQNVAEKRGTERDAALAQVAALREILEDRGCEPDCDTMNNTAHDMSGCNCSTGRVLANTKTAAAEFEEWAKRAARQEAMDYVEMLRDQLQAFTYADYTGQEEALPGIISKTRTVLVSEPEGVKHHRAEHDARVRHEAHAAGVEDGRKAALEPLLGIMPHQHCESCAAFIRALGAKP